MISDFIYKYYIDPIRNGQAYTIVDTMTYALILLVSLYLIYRWLQASRITIDRRFVLATLPYVAGGGFLRVVQDTGLIKSDLQFLLVTPLIFFVIFFYAAFFLIISSKLEKWKVVKDFIIPYSAGGFLLAIVSFGVLVYYGITHPNTSPVFGLIILSMAAIATLLVFALLYYGFSWKYSKDPIYLAIIAGHMLDASATSFGIDLHPLNYVEQHVVGSALIAWTGTAFSMFPLKLIVIIPAIYILEYYRRDNEGGFFYLVVLAMIVVGLAPGIRDMMRMVLYV